MRLEIPTKDGRRWDLVALGEVMLRFDPGETRVHTAREFRVGEGGGEYNVARGLKRCFGLDTALVLALADNPVGRLVGDRFYQGGRSVRWVTSTASAREPQRLNPRARSGPAGVCRPTRPPEVCSHRRRRGLTAIFAREGARWLHTGGIFCALSETTPQVAREAMETARRHGAVVSFDLNYRESLWRAFGGQARAIAVNRSLVPLVDVLLGNEEDFSAALGLTVRVSNEYAGTGPRSVQGDDPAGRRRVPGLRLVARHSPPPKTAT
jgi:2-dehydro-3-deoxygluconokinase